MYYLELNLKYNCFWVYVYFIGENVKIGRLLLDFFDPEVVLLLFDCADSYYYKLNVKKGSSCSNLYSKLLLLKSIF